MGACRSGLMTGKMPPCCPSERLQRRMHRGMPLLTTSVGAQLVAARAGVGVLPRGSAAVATAMVVVHAPTRNMKTSELCNMYCILTHAC